MGYRHHRPRKGVQIVLQHTEGLNIQIVGRLVQQQHVGGGGQDGQQEEPPLLAAGQLADGAPLRLCRKEELLQQLGGGEHSLPRLDAVADLLHIVDHPGIPVHIGHLLAEVADADGLPRLDRPGVGGQLPGQQVEEGGLAAAVGPHDADAVVPQEHAVEVPHHGASAEALGHASALDGLLT